MKTVLVMEDELSVRGMLRRVLYSLHQKVLEAQTVEKGMKLLFKMAKKGNKLDLVIIERYTPNSPLGESVVPEIKRRFPETKVILLTWKRDPNTLIQAFAAGVDTVVVKKNNLWIRNLIRSIKTLLRE
jgi:DNA-binding NarL/FixJ family response regulator